MIYRLGIDLGATNTAAAVSLDGAPAQALRLAAERVELPSVLYVTSDGALLLGSEASTQAASDPFRAVSDPVRRLADDLPAFDDGIQHVAAADAVAAILTYVVEAATREHGGPPAATMVSQPAGWDDYQRSCLVRATAQADLPNCRLVPDVAAAARGVVARADPGPDAQFLVVDLGGGSCTAALAQRTSTGVEVIDHICAPHPSGDDFDEAVFRLVGGSLGDHGRELTSDDPAARARAVEVRRACRQAKEILSSSPEASVTVGMPGFSKTVTLARDEFESLIRPNLRDGLAMATQLLNRNPVPVDQLVGVALVGGASRMPIVAELVRREFDLPVVISDEPELEIALGLVSPEGGSSPPAAVLDPPAAVLVPPAAVLVPPAAVLVPVGDVSPDRAASSGPTAPAAEEITQPTPVAPPTPTPVPVSAPVPIRVSAPTLPTAHHLAPGPVAAAPTTETSMPVTTSDPEHLIFDYFSNARTEPIPAPTTGSVATRSPRRPQLAASAPPTPPQRPPQQRPGSRGPAGRPPGQRPGPPTQPHGAGGRGGPGGPGYPPHSDGGGPFGSRRNLVLAIVGGVVLLAAAVGIGFWIARPGDTTIAAPPPGPVSAPATSVNSSAGSTTPNPSSPTKPTASGASTSGAPPAPASLPAAAPIAANLLVVPMRTEDDDSDERPLYLVDSSGETDPVKLSDASGKLANPMLQPDRTSVIYLEGGVLHVMASDGTGERNLTKREPSGCDDISGASWSQADAGVLVVSCRSSKKKYRLLVVDTEGRLIRRLDAGEKRFGDVTLSPDGQTVLFWASESTFGNGGSLYTLPIIGTGDPKQVTSGDEGLDGDPSWSPDGTQIAFTRLVGGPDGNPDVYVMNADGSGQRAIAETKADDVKPVWSPDGKNLLIVSDRKSAFGAPGKTWDLWLTRVSDGEVLSNFDLKADQITTPTWTYR